MSTKMKGLLKGLRYISNIFEAEDKEEPEMQIGLPTDVKHVAHIGFDGTSTNSPSWMNDYKSAPSIPLSNNSGGISNGAHNSSSRDLPAIPLPRPSGSRRNMETHGSESSSVTRHPRRHRSGSAGQDNHDGSRRGRRERNAAAGGAASTTSSIDLASYSSSPPLMQQDINQTTKAPKESRRRKVKGSSSNSGMSAKPSRSKTGAEQQQHSSLKPTRDEQYDDNEEEG